MIAMSLMGCDLFIKINLSAVEVKINILISAEFILRKIVALEATDGYSLF